MGQHCSAVIVAPIKAQFMPIATCPVIRGLIDPRAKFAGGNYLCQGGKCPVPTVIAPS